MWHLGHVEDVGLVADGLAQGNGQGRVGVLELVAGNQRAHAHHIRVGVGHLDANRSFSGNRRDDADAEGGQAQGDVVLEVLDLADANARRRHNLVEGDRGANLRSDFAHFNFEVGQRAQDVLLVLLEFFVGHAVGAVAVVHQFVHVGQLEPAQIQGRVVLLPKFLHQILELLFGQGLLLLNLLHFELHVVLVGGCVVFGGCLFLGLGLLHFKGQVLHRGDGLGGRWGGVEVDDCLRCLGFGCSRGFRRSFWLRRGHLERHVVQLRLACRFFFFRSEKHILDAFLCGGRGGCGFGLGCGGRGRSGSCWSGRGGGGLLHGGFVHRIFLHHGFFRRLEPRPRAVSEALPESWGVVGEHDADGQHQSQSRARGAEKLK